MLHLDRMLLWIASLGESVRAALRWASCHTGLPVVVVAATAIVVSWHVFRRTLRFAIQIALAAALLFAATRWGLLRW
jgi:uncharacterized integral membrane protein